MWTVGWLDRWVAGKAEFKAKSAPVVVEAEIKVVTELGNLLLACP